MSLRTLLIWCIIAGFLGGGALLLRQQHAESARSQPVEWARLQFDPASIVSLEMGPADLGVVIERSETQIDEWTGTWSSDAGTQSWGVSPTRVRGALRTLATTRVRLSENRLVESDGGIRLSSRDGSEITVSFGTDRAGGRSPIRLEQRDESGAIERVLDGWVESRILDAFTFDNALDWRDPKLMNIALSSVQNIRVSAGEHSMQAELIGTRWMITDPFSLHADRDRVESLIRTMTMMEASDFIDTPIDESTTGLGAPIAKIDIETEDHAYSISLGQQADLSAEQLYANFSRDGLDTVITVPVASLSKLTAYPDAYIASIAHPNAQTSVSALRVFGRDDVVRFESVRDQGEWQVAGSPVDTITKDAIGRLITLLSSTDATAARVIGPETAFPRVIAGVALVDQQGEVLGSYDIALEQTDEGISLLVAQPLDEGRRVVWAYVGENAQATATWLTLSAGRPVSSN